MKYIEVWNGVKKLSRLSVICSETEEPNYLWLIKRYLAKYTHILVHDFEALHRPETITLDKRIEA